MTSRIRLLLMGLFLALPHLALAQGTITGTVVDGDTDVPLPGVNVILPALNTGAATDLNGTYTIQEVPAGDYTLEARFVGYRTVREEISVVDGDELVVNFEMGEDALQLDELVVTGAGGPVEKRKLGNSVATINADALETAPIQTFSDVLQGREPGLVGLPSGGLTGEGARIRIRGSSSLSLTNEPLVYVDGVRVNNGGGFGGAGFVATGGAGSSRLDDINPDAVERVEILKGAAAATLYGTEASNGVIQIFTKRGQVGPPRFSFSIEQGAIRYPDAYPDNVGFTRTAERAQEVGRLLGRDVQAFELIRTNPSEDILGTGYSQTYSASISGGGEGVTYFVNGRFQTEDGPFSGDDLVLPDEASVLAEDEAQRAQGTATLNIFPTENLQFSVVSSFADSRLSTLETNNNIYGVSALAQFAKPELISESNRVGNNAFATLAEATQQTIDQETQRFFGALSASYRPLDVLTFDATFGVDFTDTFSEEYRPFAWNIDDFATDTPLGRRRFSDLNNLELSLDVKGTLQNVLSERFESTLILGAQGFITRASEESGEGVNFPGPGFNVTEAAEVQQIVEEFEEVVNLGVFAQEQIGFDDFLFLTVGGRYDANSAFGDDFDGVFYPKASLSFVASDAPFWPGSRTLSTLRLRTAVGQSGLQPNAFDALTTFGSLASISGPGTVPENLGDPSLKPEVSTEWEVGAEIGLFNDALITEATYWNRTVEDALVNRQFVPSGGFIRQQLVNIGQIQAQGLELNVRGNVFDRGAYALELFANASYLYEEVTDLGGAPPLKVGGSYPRYRNFIVEGYAPGANFGVQLLDVPAGQLPVDFNEDGAPDTEAEVLAYLGGLTVEDFLREENPEDLPTSTNTVLLGTNSDSPTGSATDFYLGKPQPDWQGAFGGTLRFLRHFEVRTLFEYKAGNFYINNLTDAFRQANSSIGRNLEETAEAERAYITGGVDAEGNPQNDPAVRLAALETWLNDLLALAPFSGLNTIEQADYLRWRELSLTYNVPAAFLERYGLRDLAITLSGRNLALWTKYDGVDPELNAIGRGGSGDQLDNNFLEGVEAFGFPIPRRFLFKLRLGF